MMGTTNFIRDTYFNIYHWCGNGKFIMGYNNSNGLSITQYFSSKKIVELISIICDEKRIY